MQTESPADEVALQRILDTLLVVGSVDGGLVVAPEEYSGYREVVDESGTLSVEVPNEWADLYSSAGFTKDSQTDPTEIGVGLNVATDIGLWYESWAVPGLYLAATADSDFYDINDFFFGEAPDDDWFYRSDCVRDGVDEYDDGLYAGLIGEYVECGSRRPGDDDRARHPARRLVHGARGGHVGERRRR